MNKKTRKLKCVIDIADTVFPQSCGLYQQVRQRVAEATSRFATAFAKNGIKVVVGEDGRLENLPQVVRQLENKNPLLHRMFMDYCYGPGALDYSVVQKDPALRECIKRIGPENIGFYSSDPHPHIRKVLKQLGINDLVRDDKIMDVAAGGDLPKPTREGLLAACRRFGFRPEEVVVFDDWQRVLDSAAQLGVARTVWVNERLTRPNMRLRKPDLVVSNIHKGLSTLFMDRSPPPRKTPEPSAQKQKPSKPRPSAPRRRRPASAAESISV